jgi:hypothetical protein
MKMKTAMTIQCGHNWRIKSYQYGYQVERRINETRWRAESYYPEISMAVDAVLKERIQTETQNVTVHAPDADSARSCTATLVSAIEAIAAEIQEGVRNVR